MPTVRASANLLEWAWGMYNNVVGFPGKIQGFVQNALINTIDQVQTAQALRETRAILAEEQKHKSAQQEAAQQEAAQQSEKSTD